MRAVAGRSACIPMGILKTAIICLFLYSSFLTLMISRCMIYSYSLSIPMTSREISKKRGKFILKAVKVGATEN